MAGLDGLVLLVTFCGENVTLSVGLVVGWQVAVAWRAATTSRSSGSSSSGSSNNGEQRRNLV